MRIRTGTLKRCVNDSAVIPERFHSVAYLATQAAFSAVLGADSSRRPLKK